MELQPTKDRVMRIEIIERVLRGLVILEGVGVFIDEYSFFSECQRDMGGDVGSVDCYLKKKIIRGTGRAGPSVFFRIPVGQSTVSHAGVSGALIFLPARLCFSLERSF